MPNSYFKFKQFTVHQDRCAMKVTTDACLFGAWLSADFNTLINGVSTLQMQAEQARMLDIGTGTGLLSLMFAQQNENCAIDAIELEPDAAAQARENIAATKWKERIAVIHTDFKIYDPLWQYDVIICNPPFHEGQLPSGNVQKDKAHHSLGLTFPQLIVHAKRLLKPRGSLYLLIPSYRTGELVSLANIHGLYMNNQVMVRQTGTHNYFRNMLRLGDSPSAPSVPRDLVIESRKGRYSEDFIELLKDYYLHL